MRSAYVHTVLALATLSGGISTGCSQSASSATRQASADHYGATDLSAWWAAERRWSIFDVRAFDERTGDAGHPRVVQPWGREEGALIGRRARPLSAYLDRHSERSDRPAFEWPKGGAGYFLEFDPPMREWPVRCDRNEATVEHGKARAYGGDGVPFARGEITRRVEFYGFESVQIGEQPFDRCAVLLAETKLNLGWWLTLKLRERIWLSQEAGLIRRDESIKGTALLIFSLGAERTYERDKPGRVRRSSSNRLTGGRRWQRAAFYLDPIYPRPRLQGLIVEWADPVDELSKVKVAPGHAR